jgi:hypothetical protein
LRMRALTDSMAFVVHTIRRISRSNCRNGVNSAVRHEVAHVKWLRCWEAVVSVT